MAIYPRAIVKIVERFTEPMVPVRVNAHTAVTSTTSLFPFFNQPGQVCSHFYLRQDGVVEQYVDTAFQAAADKDGNVDTISIEAWDGFLRIWRDGDPVPPFTDAQIVSLIDLLIWIFEEHPSIPRRLATDSRPGPSSHGLSWHRLGIDPWRVPDGLLYSATRGKVCPGDARITALPGVLAVVNGESITKTLLGDTMQNPFLGRVTSEYGPRGSGFHAGVDIAPPVAGTVGQPVWAAFSGRVEKTVSTQVPGAINSVLAPGRTGNGVIVLNPDGERQVYNHVKPAVTVGQWVEKGTTIGHTDRSGTQTGPHLHFETWAADRDHFDPRVLFRKYGVTPGEKAGGSIVAASYLPLVVDGDYGFKTKVELQRALHAAGYYTGLIDGDFGELSNKALQELLRDTKVYTGRLDGDFGPASTRALQTWLKSRGFYPEPYTIDGDFGPATVRGLQSALNAKKVVRYVEPAKPEPPKPEPTSPVVEPAKPEPVKPPTTPDPEPVISTFPSAEQIARAVVDELVTRLRGG